MSLTPAQRERMAQERTLTGYERAVMQATQYGWPPTVAHRMARKVVRRMRKGDAEAVSIRQCVPRKV